jgi:CubicO group peptidase (beta-lactamase class C family)
LTAASTVPDVTSLVSPKIEQLRDRALREIENGLLPSCQFALALDGEVVVQETLGEADDHTRYTIFSATKPVVAAAVWVLIQDGAIDISRPVAGYVPEFGTNGKDVVTVEQVMLHTSGFPHAPMGAPVWYEREGRLRRFSEWRLNWEPGTKFEYHATSAHWVLAELIERVSGCDYRDAIRQLVLDPHGLDRLQLGVPLDQQADIALLEERGEPATRDEMMAVYGIPELPVTEVTDEALMRFNIPEQRHLGVPGGGAVSDAGSLALFYQALLHNPKGVWSDEMLTDVKTNVRNMFTVALSGHPVMRTLGLCLAGDDGKSNVRGFGRTVSGGAFGHNGAAGQLAWADPATGLSFVYLTNGIDKHSIRQGRRGVALSSIAAECAA